MDGHCGGASAPPGKAATQVVNGIHVGCPSDQPGQLGQDPPGSVAAVEWTHDGVESLAERAVGCREWCQHVEHRD